MKTQSPPLDMGLLEKATFAKAEKSPLIRATVHYWLIYVLLYCYKCYVSGLKRNSRPWAIVYQAQTVVA